MWSLFLEDWRGQENISKLKIEIEMKLYFTEIIIYLFLMTSFNNIVHLMHNHSLALVKLCRTTFVLYTRAYTVCVKLHKRWSSNEISDFYDASPQLRTQHRVHGTHSRRVVCFFSPHSKPNWIARGGCLFVFYKRKYSRQKDLAHNSKTSIQS